MNAGGFVAACEPEQIALAIEQAQGEVDGYLYSGNYPTPLAAVPTNIKNYTVSLAVYNLSVAKGFTDDKSDEELRHKAEAARKFLRDLALGKMRLPEADAGDGAQAEPGQRYFVRAGIQRLDTGGYY